MARKSLNRIEYRGGHIRLSQAIRLVAENIAAWIVIGESLRDLDNAERLKLFQSSAEAQQNSLYKRSEIPGIVFRRPTGAGWQAEHGAAQRNLDLMSSAAYREMPSL